MTVASEMLKGIEDALWLPAWANAVEEEGGRLPRNITRETADPIPMSGKKLARNYASLLQRLNNTSLGEIHHRAEKADGRSVDPEELGYYLTMQGLGHGVSWTDDHEPFKVVLPSGEAYATRSGRRWHLDGYASERFAHTLRDPVRPRRRRRR